MQFLSENTIEMKNVNSVLLISHSTSKSGGGEDDFTALVKHMFGRYKLYGILPEGERVEYLSKYFEEYLIVEQNIFPFGNLANPWDYFIFIKKAIKINKLIRGFLSSKKIDCSYINSSVNFSIISILKRNKIPVVLSIKEIIKPDILRNIILHYINSQVCKSIVISKYLYGKVDGIIESNKVEIVYSGIDEKYLESLVHPLSKETNIEDDCFRIVNIGVIAPYKGQLLIIKAIRNIEGINIRVDFVGRVADNKYFVDLQNQASRLPPSIKVTFAGEQQKKEVYRLIQLSSIVIVSSLEEGMSFVILESLLLNKAVISSKVGIAEELIRNNENGFIFARGDYNKLNEYLRYVIKNREVLSSFNRNTKRYYEQKFNLNHSLERIEGVILKCIQNSVIDS